MTTIRTDLQGKVRAVEKVWFTRKEAAEYMGKSVEHVKRLNLNGELRFSRPKRAVYILKSDVDNYLKNSLVWK